MTFKVRVNWKDKGEAVTDCRYNHTKQSSQLGYIDDCLLINSCKKKWCQCYLILNYGEQTGGKQMMKAGTIAMEMFTVLKRDEYLFVVNHCCPLHQRRAQCALLHIVSAISLVQLCGAV